MERKAQFESILSARQAEISKMSDLTNIQATLKSTMSDINNEKMEAKMELDMIKNNIVPPPSFPQEAFPYNTVGATFTSITKVQEMESDDIDQDELLRDLEIMNCK